ncbi:hypothetical protein HWV62_28714 [Athelia sp. TMB]|nr:hypothetical protein HWV62_28714 [Athelia sp. TMB]
MSQLPQTSFASDASYDHCQHHHKSSATLIPDPFKPYGSKDQKCPVCDEDFRDIYSLARHIENSPDHWQCPYCDVFGPPGKHMRCRDPIGGDSALSSPPLRRRTYTNDNDPEECLLNNGQVIFRKAKRLGASGLWRLRGADPAKAPEHFVHPPHRPLPEPIEKRVPLTFTCVRCRTTNNVEGLVMHCAHGLCWACFHDRDEDICPHPSCRRAFMWKTLRLYDPYPDEIAGRNSFTTGYHDTRHEQTADFLEDMPLKKRGILRTEKGDFRTIFYACFMCGP